jgi:hypothetical protein
MVAAVTVVGLLGLVFSAPALARPRNRVKLTVPAKNTAGEAFPIHMSGFIVAPANVLTYYESKASCPVAFHTAKAVGNQPGAAQFHPGKRGRPFSVTIEPSETTPGIYHICAYLINGHKTYARATGQTDTTPV